MKLDIEIERIENGFIVTEGGRRQYYKSMRNIVDCKIGEVMDDADRYFNEHDSAGEKRRLTFNVSAL